MTAIERKWPRGTEHLAAATVAVLAAVLMTWPLSRSPSDHILDAAFHWDAYTNAMIMGGRVDALLARGPLSFYDDYFFAPLPHSIVYNENLFGLSLIFAPFYLAGQNPLLAYNLTLLLSMALSVFFTHLLVRRLTGSAHAGVLAGLAFAFSPYVMFELGRIQLIATQWIPACFLFLHRAVLERRLRDSFAFWICYLLQIGTCLYYAMFLIPLLLLSGGVLFLRKLPSRKFLLQFVGIGLGAGAVALFMVHPYFSARSAFTLERSLAFASSYDGRLEFFGNVPETNRTLTALQHHSKFRGAYEEIAFPGFTVLGLLSLSLILPLLFGLRTFGARKLGRVTLVWLAITSMAIAATLFSHSMLAGAFVFGLGTWHQHFRGAPLPFSGDRGLFLSLLLLSVVMFLGLWPAQWRGEPVHGLYYYFHNYFPGFNGIRKVSRQAVMTTFSFVLLASFGCAWLFSKVRRSTLKLALLAGLLGTTVYELRSFPHPLRSVWAGKSVPDAYRFLAQLPREDLITIAPQNDGLNHFWGDRGMALHNYLALYHKHRFLNGQSSWLPPVNDLVRRAMMHLPEEGARRALAAVGARHLLIHAGELKESRRSLPDLLAADPEHYQLTFSKGSDFVFALPPSDDPTLALLEVPPLPPSAQSLDSDAFQLQSNLTNRDLSKAHDSDLKSYWSGGKAQSAGQFVEFELATPRRVVALEIENAEHVMDVPLSFELSVAETGGEWERVENRPKLRLYRAQIYSPKTFIFRVVLPEAKVIKRLRITLEQPVPGFSLLIHEARLYALP